KARLPKGGHHKIELLGISRLSYDKILAEVSNITPLPAPELKILRIDLAVDVHNFSIEWFRRSVIHRQTQVFSELGSPRYSTAEWRWGWTIQFGKRPDCVRIYDKTAELEHRYAKLTRQSQANCSFEEWSGYRRDAVITRIERQYSRKLPAGVDS